MFYGMMFACAYALTVVCAVATVDTLFYGYLTKPIITNAGVDRNLLKFGYLFVIRT